MFRKISMFYWKIRIKININKYMNIFYNAIKGKFRKNHVNIQNEIRLETNNAISDNNENDSFILMENGVLIEIVNEILSDDFIKYFNFPLYINKDYIISWTNSLIRKLYNGMIITGNANHTYHIIIFM